MTMVSASATDSSAGFSTPKRRQVHFPSVIFQPRPRPSVSPRAERARANVGQMTTEERLDYLQSEIDQLNARNFEKDRGKAFESSYTRVFFIMLFTYFTLMLYFLYVLESSKPWLDPIVPTVGFNISTWSLPFIKEMWIQARHYYMHGESEVTSLRREVALLRANSNLSQVTTAEQQNAQDNSSSNYESDIRRQPTSLPAENQGDVERGNTHDSSETLEEEDDIMISVQNNKSPK